MTDGSTWCSYDLVEAWHSLALAACTLCTFRRANAKQCSLCFFVKLLLSPFVQETVNASDAANPFASAPVAWMCNSTVLKQNRQLSRGSCPWKATYVNDVSHDIVYLLRLCVLCVHWQQLLFVAQQVWHSTFAKERWTAEQPQNWGHSEITSYSLIATNGIQT